MKPQDWNKVENFAPSEWQTDPDKAPKELVFPMDQLRNVAGVPIYIHVCFATSGHADYSYHYIGLAVDFHFEPGKLSPLKQFLLINLFPQFRGIGFYPFSKNGFWHVDIRTDVPKVLWVRNKNGEYKYDYDSFLKELNVAG